ncbi:MAG: hypothetical protein VW339_09825 [Quisquiliibacterium sp.]
MHYSDQPPPAEIPERDTVRLGDNPAWPEFRSLPRGTPTNPSASQNRSASPGRSPASGAPSAGQQANTADPEKTVNPSDFRALADQIRKQDEKRNAQQKQKDEKTSQANELKQACATLRDELRTLESGIRIAAIDQAGQRQVMDDNQRAERTEQVRKNLQTHCKND